MKRRIETHCPPNIGREPIQEGDKIKATIKNAGSFLGNGFKFLGTLLASGVSYLGDIIDKRVRENQNKKPLSPGTKQKWETLKQGTSNVLNVSKEFYNQYLASLVNKGLECGQNVAHKIESFQNPAVKYTTGTLFMILELASTSASALGLVLKGLA